MIQIQQIHACFFSNPFNIFAKSQPGFFTWMESYRVAIQSQKIRKTEKIHSNFFLNN